MQNASRNIKPYREETEYDRRRERISEICRLLSQVPAEYLKDTRSFYSTN